MADRNDHDKDKDNAEDVPELDEIVDVSTPAEASPPPNLDLFADAGIDPEALRAALTARLEEELEAAVTDVRTKLEAALGEQLEHRLRARLPEIIDEVLAEQAASDD